MEPFIAQIMMFGGNFAPRGWAKCDGQLLAISSNTALFSLLGTTFGGDGRTTFGLPDLRGRVAIHPGHGAGLSTYLWGERGGRESVALSLLQLPSHNHTASGTTKAFFQPPTGGATTNNPNGASFSGSTGTNVYSNQGTNQEMMANNVDVQIANNGGSQPFNIVQPFLGIYHVIALVGIFPSRS